MSIKQQILTPAQLKAKFAAEGKTFSEWAAQRGYSRFDVYKVVNGMVKGRRGKGHEIAVALGIKLEPPKSQV